jgi:hypothetical protein
MVDRAELFEPDRHREPVPGWYSCAIACTDASVKNAGKAKVHFECKSGFTCRVEKSAVGPPRINSLEYDKLSHLTVAALSGTLRRRDSWPRSQPSFQFPIGL